MIKWEWPNLSIWVLFQLIRYHWSMWMGERKRKSDWDVYIYDSHWCVSTFLQFKFTDVNTDSTKWVDWFCCDDMKIKEKSLITIIINELLTLYWHLYMCLAPPRCPFLWFKIIHKNNHHHHHHQRQSLRFTYKLQIIIVILLLVGLNESGAQIVRFLQFFVVVALLADVWNSIKNSCLNSIYRDIHKHNHTWLMIGHESNALKSGYKFTQPHTG